MKDAEKIVKSECMGTKKELLISLVMQILMDRLIPSESHN